MRSDDAPLSVAIGDFLAAMEGRLKPTTLFEYGRALRRFLGFTGRDVLRDLNLLLARRYLAQKIQGKTAFLARNDCTALKTFARWLAKQRILRGSEGGSVLEALESPRPPKRHRPPYGEREIALILRAAEAARQHEQAIRDKAIVMLALDTGLRLDELRRLRWPEDLNLEEGYVRVSEDAKTQAGFRRAPLDPQVKAQLRLYLADARPHQAPGYLFLNQRGRQFTHAGFCRIRENLRQRAKKLGVQNFMLHRCRNTFARDRREMGWSDTHIMQVGGWKSAEMIARYAGEASLDELKRLPGFSAKYGRAL